MTLPAYGHLFPLTILQRCILMLALRCVAIYCVLRNALSVNAHSRYFFLKASNISSCEQRYFPFFITI